MSDTFNLENLLKMKRDLEIQEESCRASFGTGHFKSKREASDYAFVHRADLRIIPDSIAPPGKQRQWCIPATGLRLSGVHFKAVVIVAESFWESLPDA